MKKNIFLVMTAVILFFAAGIPDVRATEVGAKPTAPQKGFANISHVFQGWGPASHQILEVQKRGGINIFTSLGEFGRTYRTEKKAHPKAWPVTYLPQSGFNFVTRFVSGISDVLVLPWYMIPAEDSKPLTRRFDLPDYCWDKE